MEIQRKIINWAREKDLIKSENKYQQLSKVVMEKGNDLEAANFAMEISLKYFKNKYDESN